MSTEARRASIPPRPTTPPQSSPAASQSSRDALPEPAAQTPSATAEGTAPPWPPAREESREAGPATDARAETSGRPAASEAERQVPPRRTDFRAETSGRPAASGPERQVPPRPAGAPAGHTPAPHRQDRFVADAAPPRAADRLPDGAPTFPSLRAGAQQDTAAPPRPTPPRPADGPTFPPRPVEPPSTGTGAAPRAASTSRVPSPPSSYDFFAPATDVAAQATGTPGDRSANRPGTSAHGPGNGPARPSGAPGRDAENPTGAASGLPAARRPGTVTPPPPPASARFPDAPPATPGSARPGVPPRTGPHEEHSTETTRRLRPVPAQEPAAPPHTPPRAPVPPSPTPRAERPFVSFAEPDTHDGTGERPRTSRGGRTRPRIVAAAACVVLGAGLIGGAVTGSWLTGGTDGEGSGDAFASAGDLWHSVPVDRLFPPTVRGDGAGPGGADRVWTRIAVAPDTGCKDAFDPLLRKALAPVGCLRLLRATYTDATRSHVTTVGLLFTKADAAAMTSLKARFEKEGLERRTDLMPRPYAAEGTVADHFGDAQRASWTVSVLTDAPVVVYAVSGFADGRAVTTPQAAEDAIEPGATTTPAQAGLGHEAQGLADRVERGFRKTVTSATEKPS
ncbi:hypothetical protein ACSYGO_11775 [Streptomyces krungchingensis]